MDRFLEGQKRDVGRHKSDHHRSSPGFQQLGMAFGAGAVELLQSGQTAVMAAFVPPDIGFLPLTEAVDKVRTVPADNEFMRIAQSLGIYLGTPL